MAQTQERTRITSLEDMTRRPHYLETVPPRKSLFRYVVAVYSFPRKIASCGVSDCFQNHKKGYLVHTSEGGECSICESCAQRFLEQAALKPPKPVRRPTSSAPRSPRAPAPPATTRPVSAGWFMEESERVKARVKALKQMHQGANWLFQSLNEFHKACPMELIDALRELHASPEANGLLERLIENDASDQQLADVEQLQGLAIFVEDIRELLIERILKPLTPLNQKAESVGPSGTVALPLTWSEQVEADLNAAEQLIVFGQLFFTEENLKRLRSLPLSATASQAVRALHWDCQKGVVKGSH